MKQILVRTLFFTLSVASLAACGQKGNLYLPTEAAAAQRASLPQAVTTSIKSALPQSGTKDGIPPETKTPEK